MEVSGNNKDKPDNGDAQHVAVPLWMVADKVSFWEKAEVKLYQLISVFPVFVTFGLYSYLLIFYAVVSAQIQ